MTHCGRLKLPAVDCWWRFLYWDFSAIVTEIVPSWVPFSFKFWVTWLLFSAISYFCCCVLYSSLLLWLQVRWYKWSGTGWHWHSESDGHSEGTLSKHCWSWTCWTRNLHTRTFRSAFCRGRQPTFCADSERRRSLGVCDELIRTDDVGRVRVRQSVQPCHPESCRSGVVHPPTWHCIQLHHVPHPRVQAAEARHALVWFLRSRSGVCCLPGHWSDGNCVLDGTSPRGRKAAFRSWQPGTSAGRQLQAEAWRADANQAAAVLCVPQASNGTDAAVWPLL